MKTDIRPQSGIVAIEGYFQFERAVSLYNSFYLFPVATALQIGIVLTNRRSAANFDQQDEISFQDMNIHNANSIGEDMYTLYLEYAWRIKFAGSIFKHWGVYMAQPN